MSTYRLSKIGINGKQPIILKVLTYYARGKEKNNRKFNLEKLGFLPNV